MEGFPQRLHERYEPLRLLGRGGMGAVWAARDRRDGSTVAVKVLAESLAGDDAMRERLRREATVAARIRHPNLIRILDASLDGPIPALVMELVDGRSLRAVLRTERPMAPGRALDMVDALAGALGALHDATIVHRDVKPDNVMVRPDGTPVLLDLGLVRRVDGTALTATGTIMGTPAYLAPEICRGERPGPAADVFALGVLLAELLSPADLFPTSGPALMRCVTERAAGRAEVPIPAAIEGPLRSLVETLTAPGLTDRPSDGAAARTAVAVARRELDASGGPGAPTRSTRTARPPARPSAAPTRAVSSRAPASPAPRPRRRLPLVLTTALLLTVLVIAQSRHGEVAPGASPVPSPAPHDELRDPVPTDASVAAFSRALEGVAASPSRAALDHLRRAVRGLDPDAARRGVAWYLDGYFADRAATEPAFDRFRRGLKLLPLLVEILHELDGGDAPTVRSVHVDVATALWSFACEVGKQTVEFRQARSRVILSGGQGTSPDFVAALGRVDEFERSCRDSLTDLTKRLADGGRGLGPHLHVPWLVLRCKTSPEDHVVEDARALARSLPADGDPDARDDLKALVLYLGLDCTATHEALDAAVRVSDDLFTDLPRWSRTRWVPSCTSVAARRAEALGRLLLTELGRFEDRADEADSFLRLFLPRLSLNFQRQDTTAFLDYLARDRVIPAATHARLIASAREVETGSPASNHPATLNGPALRDRALTGVLRTEAPDDEAVLVTLSVDDEDVTTSQLEGAATHPTADRAGWPVRLVLPPSVPPGWRRGSLDVSWPGQPRIRVWSEIVTLEEPSQAARVRILRNALTALAASPSPATLEPVVAAIRDHADADSSLAALASLVEPSALVTDDGAPSLAELTRYVLVLPFIVRAALQVPRPSTSTVLPADLLLVNALIRGADETGTGLVRLHLTTTRDVLMTPPDLGSAHVDQFRRLGKDFDRALRTSLDSIEEHGFDLAPALRYLGLALQAAIGTREGVGRDLLIFAESLPPGGSSTTRILSAMVQSTAVRYLAKLGRLDEATTRAQALVDLMQLRATFWTLDHCPPDVAATRDAVCAVVKDVLRVRAPIPTSLVQSYLEHLPWLHQREAFTAAVTPRDPEVSGTLPEVFRTIQLRAAQTSPAQPYPSTTRVVSLDATGVRLSVGGLASMGLKWRAELLVDGEVVSRTTVRGNLDDLAADVQLTNPSPVAPGWRHVVVRGILPTIAGNQPFTLADRWVCVLPEEP